MYELLLNRQIYERVIQRELVLARSFVWLLTADLKDLHVERGCRYIPFLEVLADLVQSGVAVRLFHAKEPGPRFRQDFDRYPELLQSDLFERILCPRLHLKGIVIDGLKAFVGSANLTGAGAGSRSLRRRNFEAGFLTDDAVAIDQLMAFADELYLGRYCRGCALRAVCPDPIA